MPSKTAGWLDTPGRPPPIDLRLVAQALRSAASHLEDLADETNMAVRRD